MPAPGGLEDLLREADADEVVVAACSSCQGGAGFGVRLDDEVGVAVRTCAACRDEQPMLDSAEFLADADLGDAQCPCGGEVFDVAVGFSLLDGGEVRWVTLGLRCRADDQVGVYADWSIDYEPSRHLLGQV